MSENHIDESALAKLLGECDRLDIVPGDFLVIRIGEVEIDAAAHRAMSETFGEVARRMNCRIVCVPVSTTWEIAPRAELYRFTATMIGYLAAFNGAEDGDTKGTLARAAVSIAAECGLVLHKAVQP